MFNRYLPQAIIGVVLLIVTLGYEAFKLLGG
jgi:hypothetical protein